MIDINKTYRTRDGRQVRIYSTDGGGIYPIHGAILDKVLPGWFLATWDINGYSLRGNKEFADLIEVKPRIKREVWLNIYKDYEINHRSKHNADAEASSDRIACGKVEIDVEEGHGL
jgi:hypothetical protein